MKADILDELRQLQRYAAGLQGLLTEAQAQAPRAAEGADGTGSIRVVLGADGFPDTIRVESGWERRLGPPAVGGAVSEAFSAAMGQRLAEWTATLQRQGWQSDVERLRDGGRTPPRPPARAAGAAAAGAAAADGASGDIPAAFRRQAPPREIGELAEDMIKAFDDMDRYTRPPAPRHGTGTAAAGKVVATLSPNGGLGCTVDPQWVARQSAAALMNALNEALAAAKADLARTGDQGGPATGALDGLLGEALAVLTDPRRAAGH